MAMENVELMHECCPQHMVIGKLKIKYDKETDEEGKGEKSEYGIFYQIYMHSYCSGLPFP